MCFPVLFWALIFTTILHARPFVAILFMTHGDIYQVTLLKQQEVSQKSRQRGTIVLLISLKRKKLVPEFESLPRSPQTLFGTGSSAKFLSLEAAFSPSTSWAWCSFRCLEMPGRCSTTELSLQPSSSCCIPQTEDEEYLEMTILGYQMSCLILKQIHGCLLDRSAVAIWSSYLI